MKKEGFTLIELLVVIAIIALLLAVLLPSLRLAKDLAKRAVCLSHLHSMGMSWVMYADENDGRIVSAKTARVVEVPGPGGTRSFRMNLGTNPGDYHFEPSWAGWWDGDEADIEAHQACIRLGALYPYCDTIKIYRCPEGRQNQWRTYAIVDSMNGHWDFQGFAAPAVKKRSELRSPAARMVFIDEGYASTESWTIWPHRIQWWDGVPLRHAEGTCFGFADGHSEYWKWQDQRTVDFANGLMDSVESAQNNPDFDRVQAAVWTLKYRP